MADVFISYSSKDRQRAVELAKVITDHGFSVWWDRQIPLGKSYDLVIKKELSEAVCILVLWSNQSVQSDYVKDEAEFGKVKDNLIPVLIDDIDLPFGFGRLQTVNLSDWDQGADHRGLNRLLSGIKALANDSGAPEPSPMQAQSQPSPSKPRSAAKPKKKVKTGIAFMLALALVLSMSYIAFDLTSNDPRELKTVPTDPTRDKNTPAGDSQPSISKKNSPDDGMVPVGTDPSSAQTALFIETVPSDASVKIMNIKPTYKPGMKLAPGAYNIRVFADGFETQNFKILIAGNKRAFQRHVELTSLDENKKGVGTRQPQRAAPPADPNIVSEQKHLEQKAHIKPNGNGLKLPVAKPTDSSSSQDWYASIDSSGLSKRVESSKPAANHFDMESILKSSNMVDPKEVLQGVDNIKPVDGGAFDKKKPVVPQSFQIAKEPVMLAGMVKTGQRVSMQRNPVTKGQWQKLMGGQTQPDFGFQPYNENDPVIAGWNDVNSFLSRLNGNRSACKCEYRLPAKAELESALKKGKVRFISQSKGEWIDSSQVVELMYSELVENFDMRQGMFRVVQIADN